MNFEFDSKKSENNKVKHGISLEDAKILWVVPALRVKAKTIDEPRFMIIR